MPRTRSTSAFLYPLLSLAMVIWGGTWPAGKIASTAARPEVTIFWRFFLTAAAFLPVLLVMQRSAARSPRAPGAHAPRFAAMPARAWLYTIATAAGMIVYNQLFLNGVRLGLAGVGGIVTPMVGALITGFVTMALQRRRPGALKVIGLLLGLAGGLVIVRIWRFSLPELSRSGNLLFIGAAATWSAVTFFSQRAQATSHFATHTFAAYALAAAFAVPFALRGGGLMPPAEGPSFWLLVLFLSVVATDFATTVFFLSASRLGTGRASSFLFIVPIAAILLSWLLLGERPDAVTLVGGALSIVAVYLVNAPQRSP
ncbi:MAG: DMT family transporter [Spirochaetes bacterium]|nr:DMT family transporter [Spirochaetota bacterium]